MFILNLEKEGLWQIYIQVKQLGKRKASIEAQKFIIEDPLFTVHDLLYDIVTKQVDKFNHRAIGNIDGEPTFIKLFIVNSNENQSPSGKISFNLDYRQQKQDIQSAFDNVIMAFNDGLFRIFLNDNELSSLEEKINLQENDKLTFIRLTMLSGRIW